MADFQNQSFVGHYSKTPPVIPGIFNGMRVEVLDPGGDMVFVADVELLSAEQIELVRTSELFRPDIADGTPVSIRGFNAYENSSIHIDGVLSRLARSQDKAWLVKDLDVKEGASRSYSRRPIAAKAWVQPAGSAQWLECRVVNASAGGVCFRMTEPLEIREKLSIRFKLRYGHEQPPVTVAVRRATDRGECFEYGCEFVDLSPEIDEIITKTIIQLQIMQK